jgi:hypothetical protein
MQSRHLLDFQTLLVCESMMAVVFAIVFMGLQRVFPYVRGARAIAISFLLIVPDTLFVGLRGQVSPVVSVLIADTLMLASLIAMYEAILQFTGGVNRRWVLWFVAFVSFAVVYFYTDVRPQLAPRLIAIALSMAFVRANTAADDARILRALHGVADRDEPVAGVADRSLRRPDRPAAAGCDSKHDPGDGHLLPDDLRTVLPDADDPRAGDAAAHGGGLVAAAGDVQSPRAGGQSFAGAGSIAPTLRRRGARDVAGQRQCALRIFDRARGGRWPEPGGRGEYRPIISDASARSGTCCSLPRPTAGMR